MQTTVQERAKQSEAIARASIHHLSNERLAATWDQTAQETTTRAVTITRGWLMDELEMRMNDLDLQDAKSSLSFGQAAGRFDRWLTAECSALKGEYVNVLNYLR